MLSLTDFDVRTVREMIDTAFGDPCSCPVDFNKIGSVLYMIARRLGLLKRHFKIKMTEKKAREIMSKMRTRKSNRRSRSPLRVSEIKIHTVGKRKRGKSKGQKKHRAHEHSGQSSYKTSSLRHYSDENFSEIYSSDERLIKGPTTGHKRLDVYYALEIKHAGRTYRRENYDPLSSSDGNRAGASYYKSSSGENFSNIANSEKSKPGKRFEQQVKTDAAGRPLSHSQYLEEEGNNRTNKYDKRGKHYKASDGDEERHEKIFIVSTTSSARKIRDPAVGFNPVVTQEQYNSLSKKIQQLQKKYGTANKRDDLRTVTSMTHPNAALNLSARLDRAESRLSNILEIVTQLASQVPEISSNYYLPGNEPKPSEISSRYPDPLSELLEAFTRPDTDDQSFVYRTDRPEPKDDNRQSTTEIATQKMFNNETDALREEFNEVLNKKFANLNLEKSGKSLKDRAQQVRQLSMHRYGALDHAMEHFSKTINSVETRMASQMDKFHDDIIQMQVKLETALKKAMEDLETPKKDPTAVLEITAAFQDYKSDLDYTETLQKKLGQDLEDCSSTLKTVAEKINDIRISKCTRKKMFHELENKLTVKDINGVLAQDHFDAVTAENEKGIENLLMRILTKERAWQCVVDDFIDRWAACADIGQVNGLQENIQEHFKMLNKETDDMLAIVSPPARYTTNRKVVRDKKCVSCGAPPEAKKDKLTLKHWQEVADPIPDTKRFQHDEMVGICIPGLPIPHPLDQGSYICQHDCGLIVKEIVPLKLLGKKMEPDSRPDHEDES